MFACLMCWLLIFWQNNHAQVSSWLSDTFFFAVFTRMNAPQYRENTCKQKHGHTHTYTGGLEAEKQCVNMCQSLLSPSRSFKGNMRRKRTLLLQRRVLLFSTAVWFSQRPQTLAGRSWIMLSYNSKSNTVVLLTCDWKQWFLPLLYSVFWAIVLFGMCSVHGAICSIWTVWSLRYIIQYLMSEL